MHEICNKGCFTCFLVTQQIPVCTDFFNPLLEKILLWPRTYFVFTDRPPCCYSVKLSANENALDENNRQGENI